MKPRGGIGAFSTPRRNVVDQRATAAYQWQCINLLRHDAAKDLPAGSAFEPAIFPVRLGDSRRISCFPRDSALFFGGAAGIAEMLLQSHNGVIRLLPALPDSWPEGRVTGVRARGGVEVSIDWLGGKLTRAILNTQFGGHCRIRYGPKEVEIKVRPGSRYVLDDSLRTESK